MSTFNLKPFLTAYLERCDGIAQRCEGGWIDEQEAYRQSGPGS